jgi:O-antigen/teichoic acid export membrane protein
MLLLTWLIWLFGADLIALAFGEEFREAATPLLVLSICHVVTAFFGISLTFMILAGGQRYVFYAYLISVSAAIYASTQLIPHYGVSGVAFAELVMVIAWHTYIWTVCRRKYGYDLSLFGLITNLGRNSPNQRPQRVT